MVAEATYENGEVHLKIYNSGIEEFAYNEDTDTYELKNDSYEM